MWNYSKYVRKMSDLYYIYIYPLLSKKKIECPFCGWKAKIFLPFGVKPRKNARCPKCGSLERHRLYYLYLKEILPKDKQLKVIHFAPEKIITSLLKSYSNIEYLSIDIEPHRAMKTEDITRLTFSDNSFDIIFCSHVLEHVENDRKAMQELFRILKPGGFAILQVPVKNIEKTFEDFTVKDPKEREKVFGQSDHVRIYGKDYLNRLEQSGFKVRCDNFFESLDKNVINKYGLKKENIYFCYKE